jgi:DNA polymerase-4
VSRTILHADMDAFYAAIEQRDDPRLRGQPVIVAGLGRRGVVSTASYEARRFGVRSAMPTARARELCPDGVYLTPRMDAYVAVSAEVQAVFERYTPEVEPLSLDEAFLDVSGSRALFGDGAAIARRIKDDVRAATGLTVSVGVAPSKYVAKVASDLDKPDGLVVVAAGTERAFLAPLPVARLWGAGPVTVGKLEQHGLRTIGDVQRTPEAELARWVGAAAAAHFAALAQGVDPRAVEPDRETRSVSHETTFDVDVRDDDALATTLLALSEGVGRRLRRARLVGHVVRLKLRFPPFRTLTRQERLPAATDDDLVIHRKAKELLARARRPGEPVRLVGVGVSELVDAAATVPRGLFADAGERKGARLGAAMDAIRDRFGDDAIRHGR